MCLVGAHHLQHWAKFSGYLMEERYYACASLRYSSTDFGASPHAERHTDKAELLPVLTLTTGIVMCYCRRALSKNYEFIAATRSPSPNCETSPSALTARN
jgi:hypothetical protein